MKPITLYHEYTLIKIMEIKLSSRKGSTLDSFICSHTISLIVIFLPFGSLWKLGFLLKGRRGWSSIWRCYPGLTVGHVMETMQMVFSAGGSCSYSFFLCYVIYAFSSRMIFLKAPASRGSLCFLYLYSQ